MRHCSKCGNFKPPEAFFPSSNRCRACYRSYSERTRERSRKEAVTRNVLANTATVGECRLWRGSKNIAGYGQMTVYGNIFRVHRIAYEQTVGPVPADHELHHICGQKACCNPTHLEPVSRAEHVRLDGRAETLRAQARDAALARWHGQTGGRAG